MQCLFAYTVKGASALAFYSPSCTFRGKYDKGDKRSLGPFERSTYRNVGMQNFPINFLP